ncbi:phage portal protein [Bacillus nakamurai]|uniref:Phage portal protein n=1 Tax=Bacillus nakamurai TaxID=1793963 RepID=A0A150F3C7_9BACI|nr:ImmA/IrrE family metallo-endopeptidase [Bacillus nakamurai]KXZ13404.1 phage portal protein [Bacillus nakamurai]KXZ19002.1 phage portal protein [Bacillus nakamurai]MCC9024152.1 ImmA/IrrE family metallo-endopeptidase [Bacillus nakamurai]MCP6683774.1 ImmA/IrrE family metallo-endopeptidase [Bacillus nakamurai]MED1227095.1 ImmA/IrrE family metallo-endopeptidase [Bacillus nakamurai]
MGDFLTHLEEYVKNLYCRMGMTAPLHIDMQAIARELDIWIHFEDIPSMMLKRDGMYSIILNQRKSPEEQWEDFAHELCHVLKHTGNHFHMNKLFRELQEFQANQFMYHFCVPTFMLLNMELPQWRSHAVTLIAAAFRVTKSFAEKRLELFERRKAGIQFQKQLAYHLSGKRKTGGYQPAERRMAAAERKEAYSFSSSE